MIKYDAQNFRGSSSPDWNVSGIKIILLDGHANGTATIHATLYRNHTFISYVQRSRSNHTASETCCESRASLLGKFIPNLLIFARRTKSCVRAGIFQWIFMFRNRSRRNLRQHSQNLCCVRIRMATFYLDYSPHRSAATDANPF